MIYDGEGRELTDAEILEGLRNRTLIEVHVGLTPKGKFLVEREKALREAGAEPEQALHDAVHDAEFK